MCARRLSLSRKVLSAGAMAMDQNNSTPSKAPNTETPRCSRGLKACQRACACARSSFISRPPLATPRCRCRLGAGSSLEL
jgi:hypothetical protein